jgi:WD40 repeat protein
VRKHNPRVPRDLEAIVMKCLEKDRARRYTSAADLAADLGRWQRGEAVLAQPPSLRYLLGKQLRRYRVPLAVAAGVVIAAVVGVVVAFVQINDARVLAETKEKETKEALGREKELGAKQRALLSEAARAYWDKGEDEFKKGHYRASLNWMLRAYETAPAEDKRRLNYLRLIGGRGYSLPDVVLPHGSPVTAAAFSPDGRLIITGGKDGSAWLWDAASGKRLFAVHHQTEVIVAGFSPDGGTGLTGSEDGLVRLWKVKSGDRLCELKEGDGLLDAKFSPDGQKVLTRDRRAVRLWEGWRGTPLHSLVKKGIVDAVFDRDGRGRVLTVEGNLLEKEGTTVKLWDPASRKELHELKHAEEVTAAAFSPDGRTILTICESGTHQTWDAATGALLMTFKEKAKFKNRAAFSPDGGRVLTYNKLWDRDPILWITVLGIPDIIPSGQWVRNGEWPGMKGAVFGPDGCTLLLQIDRGFGQLWDVLNWTAPNALRCTEGVTTAAFSPDARRVLIIGEDGTARLWNACDVEQVCVLPPQRNKDNVVGGAFSPDGNLVLTCVGTTAYLREATRGTKLRDLPHPKEVSAAAFSGDGRAILTWAKGSEQTAWLWDTAGDVKPSELKHTEDVSAAALSPNGRTILMCGDQTARIYNRNNEVIRDLEHAKGVTAAAFSPDGRTILTCEKKMARFWDAGTGNEIAVWAHHCHGDQIREAAFSPDGQFVVFVSIYNDARLCDVAGNQLNRWQFGEEVVAVAWGSDGVMLLSSDRFAIVWRIPFNPPPDDPERVRAWVLVRTGLDFTEQGDFRDLSAAEYWQKRQELAQHGGDWLLAPSARRWHGARAALAEDHYDFSATAFHLRELLAEDPDNPEYLERLGTVLYRHGTVLYNGREFAEGFERLSEAVRRLGKCQAPAARLLLAMARVRLAQQLAVSAAGLPATPHGGPLLTAWPLFAHGAVARKHLADAIRQIEQTMSPDQQKDQRWQQLRKEAEALLNR